MQAINILDPNLGSSHPQLVPWVQGMRSAGYSNDQIQMYFQQQMQEQMQEQYQQKMSANIRQQQSQQEQQAQRQQSQRDNQENITTNNSKKRELDDACGQGSDPQQQQQKMQMARNITQAYSGRVTIEQVINMPFERVQQLHNEIASRLNAHAHQNQPQPQQLEPPMKRIKLSQKDSNDEIAALNQEIETFKKRLVSECTLDKINAMNLSELNRLKVTAHNTMLEMINKMGLIEEAEKRLIENKYKCVACMDNPKNMCFDGCSHIALCDECEWSLEAKCCPICQTPYKTAKKMHF